MRIIITVWLILWANIAHAANVPERIISVDGAITEIIYQLGQAHKLVGNDTSSSYPAAARKLPKVGYKRALSAEGILSLNPELVIATSEAGPPAVFKQLERAGVRVSIVDSEYSIASVNDKITVVSNLLGVPEKADHLIASMQQKLVYLQTEIDQLKRKPSVMFLLNHGGGSPMVAGRNTAADGIIRLSGAHNSIDAYEGYKPLTPEAAVHYNPDIIVLTTEGLNQSGGYAGIVNLPGISLTNAAKNRRIIALDSLLLLGFGPRTPEAVASLVKSYSDML